MKVEKKIKAIEVVLDVEQKTLGNFPPETLEILREKIKKEFDETWKNHAILSKDENNRKQVSVQDIEDGDYICLEDVQNPKSTKKSKILIRATGVRNTTRLELDSYYSLKDGILKKNNPVNYSFKTVSYMTEEEYNIFLQEVKKFE